ncbi:DUF4256 domain-containing protein [Erysipelothrix urinaevulpis]|uniref:DUF4256 domain-containing protein n=1 Tax=Erysipelothrix urinaevulpis TaxID=2683717 RepID=UPI001359D6CE|nr:DUF4256 domain-containing protein [Erysipelothrix urinaevulpis]
MSLIEVLKDRYEESDFKDQISWNTIESRLKTDPKFYEALTYMEETGGEPNLFLLNEQVVYIDMAIESPSGRRSLCFDQAALNARKKNKPVGHIMEPIKAYNLSLLNQQDYESLQKYFNFDLKTSSWIKTPQDIRSLGGALFCEKRYNTSFVFHNGASSYYAARGFRVYIAI